jgi:hypothetical protein
MTTKRTAPADSKTAPAAIGQPLFYHHLDALLHTMRCIAQYEDALCELSHELKGTTSLPVKASRELRDILEKMPSHDYVVDLESVKAILAESAPSKRSSAKKAAKSVKVGKGPVAAKKKSGRKSSK